MNITVTFRHMDASDAIRNYASEKVKKLQKFLRQPMTARVTLSLDNQTHVAETQLSSGGAHLEAKEASSDLYASIDGVIDKLERQIRGVKGAAESKKHRGGATLRAGIGFEPFVAGTTPQQSPTPGTTKQNKASTEDAPVSTTTPVDETTER